MCFAAVGTFFARRRRRRSRVPALPVTISAVLSLLAVPALKADSLGRDKGATSVQNVGDITGGMHYLLIDDDLSLLQVSVNGNQVTTQLVTYDTSNSKISGSPEYINVSQTNTDGQYSTSGVPAAQASARLFASKADVLAALTEGNGPVWQISLVDLQSNFSYQGALTASFAPHGTVYTQIATGDFLGNNLDDLLVFYCSHDSQKVDWGLKALAAVDPAKEAAPQQGPEFYGDGDPAPVTGSIVTGDFNGDGRDEIALLLNDNQTLVFYSVDPKTLEISQVTTLKLPKAFRAGQVALAAGHFRSSVSNAELVVFGQIDGESAGYSVLSIEVTPGQNGTRRVASTTFRSGSTAPHKAAGWYLTRRARPRWTLPTHRPGIDMPTWLTIHLTL